MKNLLFSSFLLLTLIPVISNAQKYEANIVGLTEIRSINPENSKLHLSLNVTGNDLGDYSKVKVVEGYAYDELGNRLESLGTSDFVRVDWLKAEFENPARAATQLSRIVLQTQIFHPSEANGSIIRIPGFSEKLGGNILKDYTEEGQAIFKAVDSLDYQLDLAALSDGEILPPYNEYTYKPRGDQPLYPVYFIYRDPGKWILQINVLDGEGKRLDAKGYHKGGYGDVIRKQSFFFDSPVQADWILELILLKDAALREQAFEFRDIELR